MSLTGVGLEVVEQRWARSRERSFKTQSPRTVTTNHLPQVRPYLTHHLLRRPPSDEPVKGFTDRKTCRHWRSCTVLPPRLTTIQPGFLWALTFVNASGHLTQSQQVLKDYCYWILGFLRVPSRDNLTILTWQWVVRCCPLLNNPYPSYLI